MNKGDVVGRYVIESLLGQGGMGSVYRAYDEVLRRSVAIKFLRASADGPASEEDSRSVVRRILREARMAAALTHANVVAIHDVGEHEGAPFIVMELVTGRSLRTLVGVGAPVADRVRWLVEAARALAAAHAAGLVHRDVKPENVVVREDGAVKVLDFGIARRARDVRHGAAVPVDAPPPGVNTTAQGPDSSFAGTPAYMAPEVLRGEASDARVDQFAWGVMAYELLAGASPWGHAGPLVLQAILAVDPPPLDASAIGIGEEVTSTVARAMAKDPAARFATMDALIGAMGASLGESRPDARATPGILAPTIADVASAPTVPATYSSLQARPPSRTGGGRRAVVVVGLLAAGLVGMAAWRVSASRRARVSSLDAGVVAAPSPPAEALRFEGLRRLTLTPGCEEYPSFTAGGGAVLFDATVGEDDHVVLLDLATSTRRTLTTGAGWQFAPALSPDGSLLAYLHQGGGFDGTYLVPFDAPGAPARKLRAGPARPSWSPDGSAVWTGKGALVERVDVKTGDATRRVEPPADALLTGVVELPDGHVVARAINRQSHAGQSILRYDPGSDAPHVLYAGETEETLLPAPGGRDVLVARQNPTGNTDLLRIPLDGSPASPVVSGAVQPTKGFAFSPDGARAVWSTCSSRALLSFVEGRGRMKATPVFGGMEWSDHEPAGVPGDPTKLVIASDRSGTRQLWVLDTASDEKARALRTEGLEPSSPAVSPDLHWIVFAAKDKGLFAMPFDGSAPARALTTNPADSEPAFARDGASVFFSTTDTGGGRAIASVSVASPGVPLVVLHAASCPATSMAADRLAYITADDGAHPREARVLDLRTRASSPLSRALRQGVVPVLRYSQDGRRVAVGLSFTELAEVDTARGTVLGTYETSAQIGSATYVGDRLVVEEWQWLGGLWTARVGAGDAGSR